MRWWTLGLLLLLVGCGGDAQKASKALPTVAAPDPWVLTTLDARSEVPALLWNGLIGVRIGRSGAGIDRDYVPLPFFMIDEYDTEGEEKIRTLPNPLVVVWEFGGQRLDPSSAKDYRQELDMRNGVLTTSWSETLGKVEVETAIHPTERYVGQSWKITPARDQNFRVESLFVSPTFASLAKPEGEAAEHVYEWAESGAKARINLKLKGATGGWSDTPKGFLYEGKASDPISLERVVSIGKSPNRIKMLQVVRGSPPFNPDLDAPQGLSFQEIKSASERAWAEHWHTDIEIDGPVEDQQAIRSFLFYLRSAIHADGDMSVSPFALSNHQYNGHVFWDADIWVLPALALIDRGAAAEIARYRLAHRAQYESNFQAWLEAGRPTSGGPLGPAPVDAGRGAFGAALMTPWEGSVSGKETVPGPSRFQHHITGSTAVGVLLASTLGLVPVEESRRYVGAAGHFYRHRAVRTDRGWEILDTMSPDEHHTGDNDLYTNLVAQWAANGGTWSDASRPSGFSMQLPADETSFLTYDNDPLRGYKQAAAVLAIYPLQYPPAEKQAKVMMERFADKVIKNGPAMTDSIHSVIWSRLAEKEKAYAAWHESWRPFTDHPLMLFSEKRNRPITYFTTGAAGSLQSVIYGFLGFRIDSKKEQGAAWTKKLLGEHWLSIKPNLPQEWKSVKFKNFTVLDQKYTLTATHTGATVTQGE